LELIIRNAQSGDLSSVLEIERASFDDPYPESLFVSFLQRFPKGFRVAVVKEILVGYCVILPWKERDSMVITSLAVAPEYRRRGIATLLLQDAIATTRQVQGAKILILQVSSENSAALKLYYRFGFAKTLDLPDYYGEGKNGVEMRLELGSNPIRT
jgi:[ribosomal protein S18]-alanine N-acetyltransferase